MCHHTCFINVYLYLYNIFRAVLLYFKKDTGNGHVMDYDYTLVINRGQ